VALLFARRVAVVRIVLQLWTNENCAGRLRTSDTITEALLELAAEYEAMADSLRAAPHERRE
jgi:hypothetical protein